MLAVVLLSQCEDCPDCPDPVYLVNVPDAALLIKLIDCGVDTNGDSLISYNEAEAVTKLIFDLGFGNTGLQSVKEMTGIEAFINLDTLFCPHLWVKELDLSNLTKLKYLEINGEYKSWGKGVPAYYYSPLETLKISNCSLLSTLICYKTSLAHLDVSGFTNLEKLDIHWNRLTELDVSSNNKLKELVCGNNLLTSLNVSNNPDLFYLDCGNEEYWDGCHNQLVELDFTNNAAIIEINLSNISSLSKVCVWETPFPPEGVQVDTTDSPNAYFTTDCSKKD